MTRDVLKGLVLGLTILFTSYAIAGGGVYPPQGGGSSGGQDVEVTANPLTLSNASANVGDLTIQHTPGTGSFASVDFLDLSQDNSLKRMITPQYVYSGNTSFEDVPDSEPTASQVYIGSNKIQSASDTQVTWTDTGYASNGAIGGTTDLFVGRSSAGVLRVGATTGTADGTLACGAVGIGTSAYAYSDQASMIEFNSTGSGDSPLSMYLIGSAPGHRLSSSSVVTWSSSGDSGWGVTTDTYLRRDGAGGVSVGNAYGGGMTVYSAGELLSDLTGTTTTANLAPAGSRIIAVSTRVKTSVTTSSATNTYLVGDGSDIDRYGASIAGAGGTTSDSTDATADPMSWSASAHGAVTLTPPGAESFTAGAVYVVVHYLASTAPTSTP